MNDCDDCTCRCACDRNWKGVQKGFTRCVNRQTNISCNNCIYRDKETGWCNQHSKFIKYNDEERN